MLRILIVGFGDIAQRTARLLGRHSRVYALVRGAATRERARAANALGVAGDLDALSTLHRIAGIADAVIHLAPPPSTAGEKLDDPRTRRLLAALSRRSVPRRFIYISTSGVYGDHAGARVDETSRLQPRSARGTRRVIAERLVRAWSVRHARGAKRRMKAGKTPTVARAPRASILRVPGIYAAERLPVERLRAGAPALMASDDVYTNHIHAIDLARIIEATLFFGRHNRVYIASDDTEMKMGEYFDAVAAAHHLPTPPRISRAQAQRTLSEMSLSFMSESRRLSNARMRRELRVRLRYPTVTEYLQRIPPPAD